MPITKSAQKALRQNKKRRARNIGRKITLKDTVKNIRKLVLENKKDEALKLLPFAYKAIDKAAKVGVIKKNTASRKKSRLVKLITRGINSPKADAGAKAPSPITPGQS